MTIKVKHLTLIPLVILGTYSVLGGYLGWYELFCETCMGMDIVFTITFALTHILVILVVALYAAHNWNKTIVKL